MKTKLFILYLLFFGLIGYSQVDTKIITVDLGAPHKNSIQICEDKISKNAADCKCKSKWLSVRPREMIAIKLINGNPFKYTYKIDTKNISFFNEKAELDKSVNDAKTKADSIFGIMNFDSSPITIKEILKKNGDLNQKINSLNSEVKDFYESLKHKKTFDKADYTKRQELRDNAEKQLSNVFELSKCLEEKKTDDGYSSTKEILLTTKENAIQIIKSIVQKFYTIDLEIYTLPIDVQGKNIDALEFKVRRFDKETKEEDLSFASAPYNIWVRGGFKIDVSAGLFFSSLYDLEYDKRDDPATPGNKIITLKNGGDYDLAFGSTINVYVRMRSWIVPTINLGAVITKNEKLQVLFGLGCMLGKQERIILTAGLSMGRVDRIADSYQVGGSYNLGDSGNIPTQSQFKFGNFFGITYNLSKVKKISLDKGIEQN